jgi:hypothetical protein
MIRQRKVIAHLIFLSAFVVLTLFVNFFHTEKTLTFNDRCPACQFQAFSQATPTIHFYHHPDLLFLARVAPVSDAKSEIFISVELSLRSPPQV